MLNTLEALQNQTLRGKSDANCKGTGEDDGGDGGGGGCEGDDDGGEEGEGRLGGRLVGVDLLQTEGLTPGNHVVVTGKSQADPDAE